MNQRKNNRKSKKPRRRNAPFRPAARRNRAKKARFGLRPAASAASSDYLRSLHNPFEYRQVRVPSRFPIASQCSTFHGSLTFSTNAAGFARVYMQIDSGQILVRNDVTQTDTVAGPSTSLLAGTYTGLGLRKVCAAAMKIRSTASFSTESGLIQAYASLLGDYANFDVYRDSPYQHIYSKGEVAKVNYVPVDYSCFEFASPGTAGVMQNYQIGFMITGAPSQTYSLQYAQTVEYLSATNTDTVPHRIVDYGDPHAIVDSISHNNPAKPDHWSVIKNRLSNAALAGVSTYLTTGSPHAAAVAAAYTGLQRTPGYYQHQSSIKSGNAQLMLTDL